MKKVFLVCSILIALGVMSACNNKQEEGVRYRGDWNRDHSTVFIFVNDSIVKAEFFSKGVGWFNDKMFGCYRIEGDSLMIIRWKDVEKSNSVYTKLSSHIDTLHIIGDTLRKKIGRPYINYNRYGNKFWDQEHYDLLPDSIVY